MAERREQHAAVVVSPRPGRGAVYEEGRHRMPRLRVKHQRLVLLGQDPGTRRVGRQGRIPGRQEPDRG